MNFSDEKKIKELNSLAIKNQKDKNYLIAKNTYQKILKINSDIPSVQYNLGIVLSILGENEKAKKCYEKVIEINPKIFDAHNNLGLIHYELGDNKKALQCYSDAIKINPKYANAYNNIGLIYASECNYKVAIDNYIKALECNNKHLDANRNLILALTYLDTNISNPIIDANNDIKKIYSYLAYDDFSRKENIKKFFDKSELILKKIRQRFNLSNFTETQTFRKNPINLNCERHHEIYNNCNIIPKFCFACFKIQIETNNVLDLIKLYFVFDYLKFPKNNWRKCMIELRDNVRGSYKGFIYCSSLEEAHNIIKMIKPHLKNLIKYSVKIKRGCTEFYNSYPKFNEVDKNNLNFMNYEKNWKKIEEEYDQNRFNKIKKNLSSIPGMTIYDYLIINNWLAYAKNLNDLTFKYVNKNIDESSFINNKLQNQMEFRKNQLLC